MQLGLEGVTKPFIQRPDWSLNELLELPWPFAAERATVAYYGSDLVKVSAPGTSRTHAHAVHCLELGIVAHPDLLAAADVVTRSSAADGVALALERLGCA